MKSFAQHIEDLLKKYECVIIPSFGGFIVYKEKAHLDSNKLYAPSHQIRFNQLLTYHDGLLAESYMKEEGINYEKAIKNIKEETDIINSRLNDGQNIMFGNIGILYKSNDGNITLKSNNASFIPENIGLPIVTLRKLSKQESKQENNNKITLEIPRSTANIIRYAAMILIIFLITLAFPTPIQDNCNQASITLENLRLIRPSKTDDIIKSNAGQTDANIHTEIKDDASYRYHLIVASLETKDDAKEYILSQNEFSSNELKVIKSKGRYRVSAKGFESYKEAISYMDSLKNNSIAKSGWILCK